MRAWKETATTAVAMPTSFLFAAPTTPRPERGGDDSSLPLLGRSLLLREEELGLEGAWGPSGMTPVKMRFEAASARRVRPRVRQR